MVKSWVIYILSVLGAVAFFIVYQQWLAWYVLMVLAAIPFVALILSFLAAHFFKVRVKAPRSVTVKTGASLLFTSSTTPYVPGQIYRVKMTIIELMSRERQEHTFVCQIGTDKSVLLQTDHCGTYKIESIKVRVYDRLGLIPICKKVDLHGEVPVMPELRMPEIVVDSNGFRAKLLSKSQSPFSELYDIREYIQGDPIKNIHWKMSAKKDDIMVKEPQEESHGRARVVMPLEGTRDKVDQNLGEVLFTIRYFLIRDIPVTIRVISRLRRAETFEIRSKLEMNRAMLSILRMPIPGGQNHE